MSNLGEYQVMTIIAKKVGSPLKLAGFLIGGGVLLGSGAFAGIAAIKKKITKELDMKKRAEESSIVHTVKKEGSSNEGLLFKIKAKQSSF